MATEQQRKQMISQIPDEQGRAAPAAQRLGGMAGSDLGRNVLNTAMALPGAGGAGRALGALPAVSRLMGAGVSGAATVGGAAKAAAPYAVPAGALGGVSVASQPEQRPAPYTPAPAGAPAAGGAAVLPAAGAASAPPTTAAANLPNSQAGAIHFDASTNTYSGANVGADASIENGRGGGAVSAQNMKAADRLASDQQFASVARLASSGNVPQVPARGMLSTPSVEHSGNSFSARKRLENLKTGASSIMNTRKWGGRNAHLNPSAVAYQQALQADLAAQGKQPDLAMQTMGLNAGLMREQMSQEGANSRAAMGERTAAQRLALDGRRLGMEETAQGFQTRQAQRVEQAQDDYLNAADDGVRNSALQRLTTLTGRAEPADWAVQVTPATKNVDGSTTQGSVIRYNKRTGDVQNVSDGTAPAAAPVNVGERIVGQTYIAPNGQKVRWTVQGWVAAS